MSEKKSQHPRIYSIRVRNTFRGLAQNHKVWAARFFADDDLRRSQKTIQMASRKKKTAA